MAAVVEPDSSVNVAFFKGLPTCVSTMICQLSGMRSIILDWHLIINLLSRVGQDVLLFIFERPLAGMPADEASAAGDKYPQTTLKPISRRRQSAHSTRLNFGLNQREIGINHHSH